MECLISMGPTPSSFEINMCAKKNCTINEPKMVDFHDDFTNLYKIFFVLSLTLFMVGEQWISGFVWHQNIMVTQYQPIAMSVVLTWHLAVISHCLIFRWLLPRMASPICQVTITQLQSYSVRDLHI